MPNITLIICPLFTSFSTAKDSDRLIIIQLDSWHSHHIKTTQFIYCSQLTYREGVGGSDIVLGETALYPRFVSWELGHLLCCCQQASSMKQKVTRDAKYHSSHSYLSTAKNKYRLHLWLRSVAIKYAPLHKFLDLFKGIHYCLSICRQIVWNDIVR